MSKRPLRGLSLAVAVLALAACSVDTTGPDLAIEPQLNHVKGHLPGGGGADNHVVAGHLEVRGFKSPTTVSVGATWTGNKGQPGRGSLTVTDRFGRERFEVVSVRAFIGKGGHSTATVTGRATGRKPFLRTFTFSIVPICTSKPCDPDNPDDLLYFFDGSPATRGHLTIRGPSLKVR